MPTKEITLTVIEIYDSDDKPELGDRRLSVARAKKDDPEDNRYNKGDYVLLEGSHIWASWPEEYTYSPEHLVNWFIGYFKSVTGL